MAVRSIVALGNFMSFVALSARYQHTTSMPVHFQVSSFMPGGPPVILARVLSCVHCLAPRALAARWIASTELVQLQGLACVRNCPLLHTYSNGAKRVAL